MSAVFELHRGTMPLFVSLPHDGTAIPDDIAARMTDSSRRVPDTDWHVSRLYAFAREMGASIIAPAYSRYVVDLNRPPDDASLYPGQNTTGLCPLVQFSGEPIYRSGKEPSPEEIGARVQMYWRPYHDALSAEITRIKSVHGKAVLWEGHSIRSVVPFLFDGRLPDFNLGTASGASCSPSLQRKLISILESRRDYSFVANGRFKGGYITRQYGDPDNGIDAIQLELAQCNYMDEDSFDFVPEKAQRLMQLIRRLLETCLIA